MRTRRADSPRFSRLRERREARDSWSDVAYDESWLGKLKPDDTVDDDLGPAPRETPAPGGEPLASRTLADDPLRRISPLRHVSAGASDPSVIPVESEGSAASTLGNLAMASFRARPRFTNPEDAASQVAETVERASAAIDAARNELDQANAWAQKTKALQISEEQIGHLLLGAKRTADAEVAAAVRRAAQIVADADARAAQILAAAEATAADIVASARSRPSASEGHTAPPTIDGPGGIHSTLAAFAETNARLSNEISLLIQSLVENPGAAT